MATFKLRQIPEPVPNTRAILAAETAPVIKGEAGDRDYLCGGCDIPLLSRIPDNVQLVNLVYKCPVCGAFNEME